MTVTSQPQVPEPWVAIVLVNWNGWRECIECMDSLLAQAYRNFHIFIVDNDSQDSSIEKMTQWCSAPYADIAWRRQAGVARYTDLDSSGSIAHRVMSHGIAASDPLVAPYDVTFIRSGGNLGFAGGCNVGIAVAGLEEYAYFWFLNPDTVVDHRALPELLARAKDAPKPGIVGSTLLFYDNPGTVFALGGGRLNRLNGTGRHLGEGAPLSSIPVDGAAVEPELSWVCGASMFVPASYIRDIGLMQEDYFLYYEEADWAERGRGSFPLGYAPLSIVYHKSGANSSKVMPLYTAGFYYRSRLRFVGRFLPDRMAGARRHMVVEMLRNLVRGRWAVVRLLGATLFWTPRT